MWNRIKVVCCLSTYRQVSSRTMLTQGIVLPGTHCSIRRLKSWHLLQLIANLSFVCFYLSNSLAKKDFVFKYHILPILLTMSVGFLNHGSLISCVLLPATSTVFTLSVFLPGTCIYVLLPDTQRYILGEHKWRGLSQNGLSNHFWNFAVRAPSYNTK